MAMLIPIIPVTINSVKSTDEEVSISTKTSPECHLPSTSNCNEISGLLSSVAKNLKSEDSLPFGSNNHTALIESNGSDATEAYFDTIIGKVNEANGSFNGHDNSSDDCYGPDDYCHVSDAILYIDSSVPGPGCDMSLFSNMPRGCECMDTDLKNY